MTIICHQCKRMKRPEAWAMCPPMNIRQGGIWVQARYEGDRLQGGNPVRSPYQGAQQGAILIAQPAGRKSSALSTYCVR